MGTPLLWRGGPERKLQQCPLFLFTFKGESSSDGLLVSLYRLRQTRQRMLERKPHHLRAAVWGKNQRKTSRREPAAFGNPACTLRTTCQGENPYGNLLRPLVYTENLNPEVVVMESAEDGERF